MTVHHCTGYQKKRSLACSYQMYKHYHEEGNSLRKHIQMSRSAGCIYDPKTDVKGKIKPGSKIFSCTLWQTYPTLFGIYDQQRLWFRISFCFLNIKSEVEKSKTGIKFNASYNLSYIKMLTAKCFMPKRLNMNSTKSLSLYLHSNMPFLYRTFIFITVHTHGSYILHTSSKAEK